MVIVENVHMEYPAPKRYVEYLYQPLERRYYKALSGVSLKINSGDRVAFLGTNGAGKTTLLKLISGLLYPTTGTISVNNVDTVKDNVNARTNVGFALNEERSFYWRLTGRQNLQFFGALDNLFGEVLEARIDTLMKTVGLEKASDKLFATYSSGMKQRLAIARGLLTNPSIMILDEPTRTLDPISVEDILVILKERIHQDSSKTLLIATHRLDEAVMLCNKVCIMREGRVLLYTDISDALERYVSLSDCYKLFIDSKTPVDSI